MSAGAVHVRRLRPDEGGAWDALAEERAPAPLFSSREWVERIGETFGGGAHLVGAFREGRLEAGVALPVRSRAGLPVATAPYLQPFLAALSRSADAGPLIALLRYLAGRYALVSLLPPPGSEEIRAYRAAGWGLAYRYTLRIPLGEGTEGALLDGMERTQRRRVRRASEEGNEVACPGNGGEHVRMVLASYGRHEKRFPLPEGPHRRLVDWIVESGRGRIYQLEREGRVVASQLVGLDERRAYALEGGADPSVRQGGETALLHLRTLSDLSSRGVAEFDFLGMNHPGISRFKESFAGALVRYHYAAPSRPLWLRLLLRIRGVPDRLEIAGEGSVSR